MAQAMVEGSEVAAAEQMEISNVLTQYLTLFDTDCNQFKLYMAPNSAVDWFGRTIRGHTKIHDYLRNEVCAEYQHIEFEKAHPCGAIEYKPTHFKTKTAPSGDVDYVQPKNKVTGITTLKLYADSDLDDDDNDVDMKPLPSCKTPEKTYNIALNSSSIAITPPTSTIKFDTTACSETESEDDGDNAPTTAKRLKRTHPSPFSYLRRQPTALKRKLINEAGIRALLDAVTDDEDELGLDRDKADYAQYTTLKYFETVGALRSLAHQKQQQFGGGARMFSAATLPSAASHYNDASAGSWDRPVRMRISYRRRIPDQQIQFALIIYEHFNKSATAAMSSRRNLMLEFSPLTAGDDVDNTDEEIEVVLEQEQQQRQRQEQQHETLIHTTFLNSNEAPAIPLMTTPTKLSNTPPATPKRKPRLPQSLSSLKRYNGQQTTTTGAGSTTPSPKRSAARSLRL